MQDREREHGQSCVGYYVEDVPIFAYRWPGVDGVWGFLREAWGVGGEETWRAGVWQYLGWIWVGRRGGKEGVEEGGEGEERRA